ncbi:hypothetical protein OIU79_030247, partial [Salix purpurea]
MAPTNKKGFSNGSPINLLNIVGILEPRIRMANMDRVEAGLGLNLGSLSPILLSATFAEFWWDGIPGRFQLQSSIETSTPSSALKIAKGGDPRWHNHMDDFSNCVAQTELIQIPVSGLHFTWHNGRQGEDTILRKIDWAWGNQSLLASWPLVKANFQARIGSDHSPILLSLSPHPPRQKPRFKFLNIWADQEGFEDTVKAAWESEVWGNPISRITSKLRILKGYLKIHHGHRTNCISDKARAAKENWQAAQLHLDNHPDDEEANAREQEACYCYHKL